MVHEGDANVVRAHRFEVVDDDRRVRAVFGRLDSRHHGGEMVGFEIFDRAGNARAWLLDEGVGVTLALALGGNQVLVLAANDESSEVEAGVSITMCDGEGAPALNWHVGADGNVIQSGHP